MAIVKCRECNNEVSNKAKACPKCGAKVKKTSWLGVSLIVLIFTLVVSEIISSPTSPNSPSISVKDQIISQIDLDYKWGVGGFGSVMIMNIKVTNKSSRDVKDLVIKCEHYANSGTKIDSNTATIFNLFPAGKTVKIRDFNMGFIRNQSTSSSCQIKDLVLLN